MNSETPNRISSGVCVCVFLHHIAHDSHTSFVWIRWFWAVYQPYIAATTAAHKQKKIPPHSKSVFCFLPESLFRLAFMIATVMIVGIFITFNFMIIQSHSQWDNRTHHAWYTYYYYKYNLGGYWSKVICNDKNRYGTIYNALQSGNRVNVHTLSARITHRGLYGNEIEVLVRLFSHFSHCLSPCVCVCVFVLLCNTLAFASCKYIHDRVLYMPAHTLAQNKTKHLTVEASKPISKLVHLLNYFTFFLSLCFYAVDVFTLFHIFFVYLFSLFIHGIESFIQQENENAQSARQFNVFFFLSFLRHISFQCWHHHAFIVCVCVCDHTYLTK